MCGLYKSCHCLLPFCVCFCNLLCPVTLPHLWALLGRGDVLLVHLDEGLKRKVRYFHRHRVSAALCCLAIELISASVLCHQGRQLPLVFMWSTVSLCTVCKTSCFLPKRCRGRCMSSLDCTRATVML